MDDNDVALDRATSALSDCYDFGKPPKLADLRAGTNMNMLVTGGLALKINGLPRFSTHDAVVNRNRGIDEESLLRAKLGGRRRTELNIRLGSEEPLTSEQEDFVRKMKLLSVQAGVGDHGIRMPDFMPGAGALGRRQSIRRSSAIDEGMALQEFDIDKLQPFQGSSGPSRRPSMIAIPAMIFEGSGPTGNRRPSVVTKATRLPEESPFSSPTPQNLRFDSDVPAELSPCTPQPFYATSEQLEDRSIECSYQAPENKVKTGDLAWRRRKLVYRSCQNPEGEELKLSPPTPRMTNVGIELSNIGKRMVQGDYPQQDDRTIYTPSLCRTCSPRGLTPRPESRFSTATARQASTPSRICAW